MVYLYLRLTAEMYLAGAGRGALSRGFDKKGRREVEDGGGEGDFHPAMIFHFQRWSKH
jgi:hypothetical protein